MFSVTWAPIWNTSASIARPSTATIPNYPREAPSQPNARCARSPDPGAGTLALSRVVIVAGAGIGGLTAALALARNGFRVVVLEQAERLEETGAGIQLSPNASRTLIDLGLESRLRECAVEPRALRVLKAASGNEIVRMPLGDTMLQRYGAPYWSIHRGDLQAVLAEAAGKRLEITIKLGTRVDDCASHQNGVSVAASSRSGAINEQGIALIGADGVWSVVRQRIGHVDRAFFTGRTAWRAVVPREAVAPEYREPLVYLWLGRDAHLVHYPVKAGAFINIVAITGGRWDRPGWSEPAARDEVLERFAPQHWAPQARSLIAAPDTWLKWALNGHRPLQRWSRGAVAVLGDAAHAMLPFLAQGGAMAIEDGAVVAQCLAQNPIDPAAALNSYGAIRRARAARVQRLAARNDTVYHLGGVAALARDGAMRVMGGSGLLAHYDWLYDWRPPPARALTSAD